MKIYNTVRTITTNTSSYILKTIKYKWTFSILCTVGNIWMHWSSSSLMIEDLSGKRLFLILTDQSLQVKEQQTYSEPLTDDRTSHPISKGDDSHPSKKKRPHFVCLYPQPCSLGHDPHFMTIVESRNEDSSVDKKLCLLAQLSFHHNSVVKRLHLPLLMLWFSGLSPIGHPLTREQDPGILKLLQHYNSD